MSKQWIDAAEVAKMIRQDLKTNWPGQKFSVKTSKYAGGASVDIYWDNGPTSKEVDAIVNVYAARGFDGMIDMAYSYRHYMMPDGKIVYAGTSGTEGSRGVVSAESYPMPAGAVPVNLGSSYVFTHRNVSIENQEAIVKQMIADRYIDAEDYTVKVTQYGSWIEFTPTQETISRGFDQMSLDRELSNRRSSTSFYVKPDTAPAPTTTTAAGVTIEQDRDWLWIRFANKPADDVLTYIKSLGARWSNKRSAWYCTDASKRNDFEALAAA